MVECNNVIPKILTIFEGDAVDTIVVHYATVSGIDASHRIVVQPEKEELTVEQIHILQKDLQVAFSQKVFVALTGVDNSSNEVQNSLLKLLEEDSERINFLLLVKNPERLVSTILSRCTLVESTQKYKVEQSSPGDSAHIFSYQNNSEVSKEEAVARINKYIQSSSLVDHAILSHLLTIRKLIIDNNINPVLALDTILIFLSKTSTMNVNNEK